MCSQNKAEPNDWNILPEDLPREELPECIAKLPEGHPLREIAAEPSFTVVECPACGGLGSVGTRPDTLYVLCSVDFDKLTWEEYLDSIRILASIHSRMADRGRVLIAELLK